MSEPSSNSEQQPESPQPRIDQHSSGDSRGGQQAAIGNNINQSQDNSTNYNYNFHSGYYPELQDKDLEPLSFQGKILSYFGVFIVLVLTLIFWFFFGLFINFPFPYHQAIKLIFSCFRGNVGSKVNKLQKQLQLENIDSQSIEKLNEIDFQARLYLRTLEHLGADKTESHERLAKTIEALKRKRSRLQDEIKPRQSKKYRTVTRVQDFFESMTLSQTEKDFIQIETILNEVAWSIKNNYPSETIIQDTINKISRETTQRADKISPSKIGILYRIEALLYEVSAKEISNLGESELNDHNRKIIDELKEQRDTLSRDFHRLLNEHNTAQQTLKNHSEKLNRLNNLIEQRESDLLNLREKVKRYSDANRSKQAEINTLNLELTQVHGKLRELQTQKRSLSEKINRLNQEVHQKQSETDKLINQLNQYSKIRMLKGEYIGNLSDRNSKYHFDRKCNHWKMLVGEYVLGLDTSREIVSSSTSAFFINKLGECDRCAGRKS